MTKSKFSEPKSVVIKHVAWDAAWERAIRVHRLRRMSVKGGLHYPADEVQRDLAEAERRLADACHLFGSITPERILEHTKIVAEV